MDEYQDIPIQFGHVLKAKNFNRCGILLVGLGGPTLMKTLTNFQGTKDGQPLVDIFIRIKTFYALSGI